MPGITRIGDIDDDYPPDSMVTGSENVFANKKAVSRIGDIDDDYPPNSMVTGSENVFVNGY